MCRREAVHHRLCGHVLVHRKRCTRVLNSRTPQKWCFPFKQREERDYCKRCRRERDDRAAEKEGRNELDERRKLYKAERRASQDERWRRDEEMGVRVPWGRMERDEFLGKGGIRVPGGRVEWHPKTRSFFGKLGNLLKGRKRDEEELFREEREERGERDDRERRYNDRGGRYDEYDNGEEEGSLDDDDISPLMDEMDDDDLFDEDYAFISHGRSKKTTKWSPRDSQEGSEQSRYRDDYHSEEEEHWSTGPYCVFRAPRGRTLQKERRAWRVPAGRKLSPRSKYYLR